MSLLHQLQQFATATVATPHGTVQYRHACAPGYAGGVTHVLLHGIGSASGNWLAQLRAAEAGHGAALKLLGWDAPGYGASTPLPAEKPAAADYAQRMWAWLDALGEQAQGPVTLVGHSLGALMAAAATLQSPHRVQRLILLSPAQGYASADAAVRDKKLTERLTNLAQLGPAGMAKKRASAMLSSHASAGQVAFVEHMMAAIDPHGYTQATHMLVNGHLAADLARVSCAVTVASGSADTITPPDGCQAVARQIGAPYVSLGEVGHSCALEAADAVNTLLGLGTK